MSVFVTGIGIVSAIGDNAAETLQSLQQRRTGIAPTLIHPGKPPLFAGRVKGTDSEWTARLRVKNLPVSRTALLGIAAAREAWGDNRQLREVRTGLIASTSVGGMDLSEGFYEDLLQGRSADFDVLTCHDSGTVAERIADDLGISGYVNTLSTACSSGVNAIMLGARMLKAGKLDRVIVGGADALTRFTVSGFASLMIYDSEWCRPFDESRNGLNLGEGAAFLVLENDESMRITGNEPLCQVSGWSNASDAYHQTASSPDGKGATLAISEAISKAGLQPADISYINVHGTGTRNNDLSESVALLNVFGKHVPPFSSTKGFTGHTLAAAGAIEAVFSVMVLRHQVLLPNLNFRQAIGETGLVPVTDSGDLRDDARGFRAVLSNSFGFGGNNSSVVFTI